MLEPGRRVLVANAAGAYGATADLDLHRRVRGDGRRIGAAGRGRHGDRCRRLGRCDERVRRADGGDGPARGARAWSGRPAAPAGTAGTRTTTRDRLVRAGRAVAAGAGHPRCRLQGPRRSDPSADRGPDRDRLVHSDRGPDRDTDSGAYHDPGPQCDSGSDDDPAARRDRGRVGQSVARRRRRDDRRHADDRTWFPGDRTKRVRARRHGRHRPLSRRDRRVGAARRHDRSPGRDARHAICPARDPRR